MQDWRRKEKERAAKAKKKAREEKLSEISAHRRDPAPLISEIYRLSVLEYEGKLNSDMKQHKKRLFDQYQSIKKARISTGLETVELVEFDPEAYENAKLQQKKPKLENVELIQEKQVQKQEVEVHFDLDDRGLPKLPEGPCPADEVLLALGLPAFSPFPYEAEEEEGFDGLEAQLEAEYELFKESIKE